MKTRTAPAGILAAMLLSIMLVSCGKQTTEAPSAQPSIPATRLSGGMNEWLSDGKMGLHVHAFEVDPTSSPTSPVTYYRIGFSAKNFTSNPLELDKVVVEFATADSDTGPFVNEISWIHDLSAPRASRMPHVIGPLDTRQLQSSGHFFFGNKDPSVNITFCLGETVVGGPFRVTLGSDLPK